MDYLPEGVFFLPEQYSMPWIRDKYKCYANLFEGECGFYINKEDWDRNWKEYEAHHKLKMKMPSIKEEDN